LLSHGAPSLISEVFFVFSAAYKHADGKKIDGRRVLVDVERARTVNGWLPRRLGKDLEQELIFRTFFPGKIPRKIFLQKMLEKNGIFRGKSFEKSFFQQIPRNFPRKVTFRGKNVRKIGPRVFDFTNLHFGLKLSG
jgi:hypothetical protein